MDTIEGWLSVEPDENAERAETLARVRADIRRDNPRLTDTQIDLIAAVAVEVQFARTQLMKRKSGEVAQVA